jgi:ethanolamine utilization microcompartment shell protein EutS
MDAIKQQAEELKVTWQSVYPTMRDTPSVWQAQVSGISAEQIDEVVRTTLYWLDQIDEPRGFKPAFHLAKAVITTSLSAAVTALKNIAAGQFGHLPGLMAALNQLLTGLNSATAFSQKQNVRGALGSLAGELSEALALLTTAQTELGQKKSLIDSVTETADVTLRKAQDIKETEKSAEAFLENLKEQIGDERKKALLDYETMKSDAEKVCDEFKTTIKNSADELISDLDERTKGLSLKIGEYHKSSAALLQEIEEDGKFIEQSKSQIEELLKRNGSLFEGLEKQQGILSELQRRSFEQSKLIEELLPRGASATLAHAFEHRAERLNVTKWLWAGSFGISILGLIVVTLCLADETKAATATQVLIEFLQRLPFAAPLVWLGWFSAVQYGNTIRVQEDYSFKAATSKAFAGYKRPHGAHGVCRFRRSKYGDDAPCSKNSRDTRP